MKFGFRISIHKDVPPDLMNEAIEACEDFKKLALSGPRTGEGYGKDWVAPASYASGYRDNYYRRNKLGRNLKSGKLTLRRVSKRRRIFAVVPINLLEWQSGGDIKGQYINYPVGEERVRMKSGGYKEEDYNIYYETGDIKG
jgi:hypothetical protein